jgi:hypothetical protein
LNEPNLNADPHETILGIQRVCQFPQLSHDVSSITKVFVREHGVLMVLLPP